MASALPLLHSLRMILLAATWCVVASGLGSTSTAHAQQQESGFLDRLDHPDRTLHYSPSDKTFGASSNVAGKQASVRAYAFNRSATLGAGDSIYKTKAFSGDGKFRTQDYATHPLSGNKAFAQTEKGYATKSMDVKEDRAANQSATVHTYINSDKPFLGRGKRQDDIDEFSKQHLTIDQVRDLLNKNK